MSEHKTMDPRAQIARLRRQLGLDESAPFFGFGVRHVATGDFLALYRQEGVLHTWGWSHDPSNAIPYPGYDDALYPAAQFGEGVDVIVMFDLGDHVYCAPVA